MNPLQRARVEALERLFARIGKTRMAGVPVQNPALLVKALGFAPDPQQPQMLLGILITPWFMNLLRLPSAAALATDALLVVGKKASRTVGRQSFEFVGAHEAEIGAFEVCSLFSPMFQLADQTAAIDTANEILKLLRMPQATPESNAPAVPSRRGFLFGRSAAALQATP
jgi:[NiFe] hydrogenase assembly HybE family chaperone